MELYSQILDNGGTAFGAILRHVRDKPTEGCVFHCTAGKDRTGILAALLLTVSYRELITRTSALIVSAAVWRIRRGHRRGLCLNSRRT